MDAQKTGTLIAQARQEKGMTQKELSLLEPLGDCLGLTVSELLSGQRGEEPQEELLRDSLRLAPVQMGRRLKRWQVLALSCLGVLLALALGAGYWYVKYHTQLLPQPVTTIAPLERSEGDQLAFQAAGLPSVYLYELTVADGAEHYQVQMEYWTSEGLMRTWPVGKCRAADLPRWQQMAFSLAAQTEKSMMHVGVNLAGLGVQIDLEEIPNLERGYGMNALREACEVDPEFGAVLACCSLAMEEDSDQNEGEEYSVSFRGPEWTGAVEAPDLYEGESCLLLRLKVS